MPRRIPLPPALRGQPFTVREGSAAGVPMHRMRGSDLERPFSGVRVPVSTIEPAASGAARHGTHAVLELADAYQRRAPASHFFSHLTAARLWRIPLARRFEESPLDVSVRAPTGMPRSDAVRGHRLRDGFLRVEHRYGLRTTDAATTWCQLGTLLAPDDLVAAADHLVLAPSYPEPGERRPYVDLRELVDRARHFTAPGAGALHVALQRVREGVESRPETHLRLLLVRGGLPEPVPGQWLQDDDGDRLARVDLLYREHRVVVEYDGEHHRTDDAQYDKDLLRLEAIRAAGWTVVVVRRRGLYGDPDGVLRRVRAALLAAP